MISWPLNLVAKNRPVALSFHDAISFGAFLLWLGNLVASCSTIHHRGIPGLDTEV